jgi:hypothetical protein
LKIQQNHIPRKIQEKSDLNLIYAEAKESHGEDGNISAPPTFIPKMMLHLILHNAQSERESMSTIPFRLARL